MVVCKICGKKFKTLTNTHLRNHDMSIKEYKEKHPNALLADETHRNILSAAIKGKNLGRLRPDARLKMLKNNPMKDPEVVKKMRTSRRESIAKGNFDPMEAFNHLPTEKEKQLILWFEEWNIPLDYVGDGRGIRIDGYCPDFINEDRKIILELELDYTSRPRNRIVKKEKAYLSFGYQVIWITRWDKDYIKRWTYFYFSGRRLKRTRIKRIWKEKITGRQEVYNLEVAPNNTYVAENIAVHNCYADAFRASLYTAFFDNSRTMGLRHCNPTYYKKEIDKMLKYRTLPFDAKKRLSGINKAFSLDIPLRMGIRFEDFLKNEAKEKISLSMLQYLKDIAYPVMINTKSDIPGREEYVAALSENPAGAAIHVTVISSNDSKLHNLEPGAPPYVKRLRAMKNLSDAGVRVVARIEPYLFLLTDEPEEVDQYISDIKEAGVAHITFDTYSYTALNQGIRQSFINTGYDFDRLFLAGCDSQPLGSLLLGKFMELFREQGISCSTFDMGNVPSNDQAVCCEVGDWFKGGLNYGCSVMAARYIKEQKGKSVSWSDFDNWVDSKGGWLSDELKLMVKQLWNLEGNVAYSHRWATQVVPVGLDEDGLIWKYSESENDYREELLKSLM